MSKTKKYDCLIIYDHARSHFSSTEETELSLNVVKRADEYLTRWGYDKNNYHDRDCIPGRNFFSELFRVVDSSQFVLLILTEGFLKNCWVRYCQMAAFKKLIDESIRPESIASHRVIPISIDVPEDKIPQELRQLTCIYFVNDWETNEEEWLKLKRALDGPSIQETSQPYGELTVPSVYQHMTQGMRESSENTNTSTAASRSDGTFWTSPSGSTSSLNSPQLTRVTPSRGSTATISDNGNSQNNLVSPTDSIDSNLLFSSSGGHSGSSAQRTSSETRLPQMGRSVQQHVPIMQQPYPNQSQSGEDDVTLSLSRSLSLRQPVEALRARLSETIHHIPSSYMASDTGSAGKTLWFVDNIITTAMHDECRNVCIFKKLEYLDCFGLSSKQCSRATKHKKFDIKIADLSVEDIQKIYKEDNDCDRCRKLACVYFECIKHPLTCSLERFLEPAVVNQDHILLRLLVYKGIHLCEIKIYIQRLSQQVQQRNLSKTIALSIKQRLLEKYKLKNKDICQVRLCWNTNDNDTLVVCILYHVYFAGDKIINGLPVIWRSFKQLNEESYLVLKEERRIRSDSQESMDFSRPLPTISSIEAQRLFDSHCNLTMILASRLKSRGFLKNKHTIEQNITISLFCRHKNFQPLGESPFPKKIGTFEVDVLEGYCTLGNRNVEIGDEIHCERADRAGFRINKCGSVGGFVKLQNDQLGVITCAHVVYSADDLEKAAASNRACGSWAPRQGNLETGVPASIGARRKCRGTVVKACFTPDRITGCVDAAVVGLDSSYTADGTFAKTKVKLDQILFAGFDLTSIPRFTGRYYRGDVPQSDIGHRVIKTGIATGLTCGAFYMSGSHVRMGYAEMKIKEKTSTGPVQKSFQMYDQIAVLSTENQDFFEIGDSGSFVFVRHPDQGLICVGMAIGKTTNNLCVVTPIKSILDSLELEELYCPEGEPMDTGSGAFNNPASNQTDIMAFLSQISSDIRSLKTDIQELKNASAQGRGASNGN